MSDPSLQEKIIAYYKAGYSQKPDGDWAIPDYVPSRVMVKKAVHSDLAMFLPGPHASVEPGEYPVECNKYGAVTVDTPNGKLGLKLDEFDIVEMIENPKKERQ